MKLWKIGELVWLETTEKLDPACRSFIADSLIRVQSSRGQETPKTKEAAQEVVVWTHGNKQQQRSLTARTESVPRQGSQSFGQKHPAKFQRPRWRRPPNSIKTHQNKHHGTIQPTKKPHKTLSKQIMQKPHKNPKHQNQKPNTFFLNTKTTSSVLLHRLPSLPSARFYPPLDLVSPRRLWGPHPRRERSGARGGGSKRKKNWTVSQFFFF